MSDYTVKITIKNGRILSRMRECGIKSLAELAKKAGIEYNSLVQIVALKKRPVGARGKWLSGVENVAGVLKCDVDDLFSDAQREMALERNSGEVYMGEAEVIALTSGDPERAYWIKTEAQRLLDAIPNDRHKTIIMRRMDGDTCGEIASDLGISRGRVNQIEQTTLRQMRIAAARNNAKHGLKFSDMQGAFSE